MHIYNVSVFLEIQIWESYMNSSQSAETNSTSSHTQSVKEKEDDKIPFCRICHESEGKFIVVGSSNKILWENLLLIFLYCRKTLSVDLTLWMQRQYETCSSGLYSKVDQYDTTIHGINYYSAILTILCYLEMLIVRELNVGIRLFIEGSTMWYM